MRRIKSAFITVHVGDNFGSALQALATQKVLESVDSSTVLINYIPPRVTLSGFVKRGLTSVGDFIKMVLKLPCFLKNKKIFESFIKSNINITEPIYAEDDFIKNVQMQIIILQGVIRSGTLFIMKGLMSIITSVVLMVERFLMQHLWGRLS